MSNEATPRSKHLKTIERRMAHLEERIAKRRHCDNFGGSATFEVSELAALRVALEVMQLYRDVAADNSYATSFLLEEAAASVELTGEGGPVLHAGELVEHLRARAHLFEELAE
jgi:hypothetical protein